MRKIRPLNLDIQRRIAIELAKELDDMKVKRIKIGKDMRPKGDPRLTKAIVRHPLFPKIKEDIILSELRKEIKER